MNKHMCVHTHAHYYYYYYYIQNIFNFHFYPDGKEN